MQETIRRIYQKEFDTATGIEIGAWKEFWNCFNQATDQGFGVRSYNDKDYGFYQELRYNNAVFAAFRTHRFQNDIARQLIDADGELKSFDQFAHDVHTLVAPTHLKSWLQTEYSTAVIRAHRAADWQRFEQDKDILPNLEWIRSTSINPGKDHKLFWGTIRPINDPFWNEHYPGDRWNCKCGLEATDKPVTEKSDIPKGTPEDQPCPGLDNNPGKDACLFNETHPYIQNAYKGAKEAVRQFIDEQLSKPEIMRYKVAKTYKNGGELLIHQGVDKKKPDYKDIYTIGNLFAKEGQEVKITPPVHFKSEAYKEIYGSLIGTKYDRKCPDLQVGDKFYEYEGFVKPFKKEKIGRMIGHGAKQSPNIIINNTKGCSDRYIRRNIEGRIRDKKFDYPIEEVWIYEKGKIRLFYKKQ
ncbi:phage minor head protein [Parabacteroides sp. AF48-14]|uniref:phage head morphogenesis protein n=1 Tax=Parabacteroides sp. AF48-14 TaxID=2292052 RepID=UPI001F1E15E5|nr:phage minor head protein [Parabacteroides sp. AF48-14]